MKLVRNFLIFSGVDLQPDVNPERWSAGTSRPRLAREEVADPVDIPVAGRAPTDASGAESRLEPAPNSSNGGPKRQVWDGSSAEVPTGGLSSRIPLGVPESPSSPDAGPSPERRHEHRDKEGKESSTGRSWGLTQISRYFRGV